MKKFFITFDSWVCPRRQMDAERIRTYLAANGWQRVHDPARADRIVVATCGFIKRNEDKALEIIRQMQEYGKKMLVYGCVPAMNPARLKKAYSGDTLIPKDISKIGLYFPRMKVPFSRVPPANRCLEIPGRHSGEERRVGFDNADYSILISTGCLGACTYCTIKKAIGRTVSLPISAVLNQVKKAVCEGKFRINVFSSDTGAYGADIGTNLPALLEQILGTDPRVEIAMLQDLHPMWLARYGKRLLALVRGGRIKSLLVPVQSASARVLSLMKRPVDLAAMERFVRDARKASPGFMVRTQVMVGFPTETEDDFRATMRFLRRMRFEEVDVFAYHEDGGHESAGISPKVPKAVIGDRVARAHRLLKDISRLRRRGTPGARLYCYYTAAYDILVQEWFLPSLGKEYRVCLKRDEGKKAPVDYKGLGWASTVRRKIRFFIQAISRGLGEVLVFSDPDVQFLGKTREAVHAAMRGKDMAFQVDNPSGTVCTGFFACRANDRTLRFWKDVYRGISRHCDDQDVANRLLRKGPGSGLSQAGKNAYALRWGYLPPVFFGGGTFNGKRWAPGDGMIIPEHPLMHHANWSIGLAHKLAQLRHVREAVNSRKAGSLPNDAAASARLLRVLRSRERFRILRMLEVFALQEEVIRCVLAAPASATARNLRILLNAGLVEKAGEGQGSKPLYRLPAAMPASDIRGMALRAVRSWENWNPLIARDKDKAVSIVMKGRRRR